MKPNPRDMPRITVLELTLEEDEEVKCGRGVVLAGDSLEGFLGQART